MRKVIAFGISGFLGCATPVESAPPPVASPPPAPVEASQAMPEELPKGNPQQVAQQVPRPAECEYVARRYLLVNADFGWSVLKACVDKGDFTALRVLLSPPWIDQIKRRPDANELLGAVIAARGGDIPSDMEFVRKKRVYLFDLGMASKAGDRLNGRDIIFLAHVGDGKPKQAGYALEMSELALYSEFMGEFPPDQMVHKEITDTRVGGGYSTSSRLLGSGNFGADVHRERKRGRYQMFYENVAEETGRMIWAKADLSDPFLVPGRDVVVLARLDGVKDLANATDQEEPDQRFLVKVIKYWEPSKAEVFRE